MQKNNFVVMVFFHDRYPRRNSTIDSTAIVVAVVVVEVEECVCVCVSSLYQILVPGAVLISKITFFWECQDITGIRQKVLMEVIHFFVVGLLSFIYHCTRRGEKLNQSCKPMIIS